MCRPHLFPWFRHHAGIVQSLLGYREHPKYMLVVMIDRMRRHALNIAIDFVARGRLESVDQIFALSTDQVTIAQKNPGSFGAFATRQGQLEKGSACQELAGPHR